MPFPSWIILQRLRHRHFNGQKTRMQKREHIRTHVGLSAWFKTTICHGTLTNFQLSQETGDRTERVEKRNEFFILWGNPIKNRRVNKICHEYLSLNWKEPEFGRKNLDGIFFISMKFPGNNESSRALSSLFIEVLTACMSRIVIGVFFIVVDTLMCR